MRCKAMQGANPCRSFKKKRGTKMLEVLGAAGLLAAFAVTCYICYRLGRAVQWEEDHEE